MTWCALISDSLPGTGGGAVLRAALILALLTVVLAGLAALLLAACAVAPHIQYYRLEAMNGAGTLTT